MDRREFAKRFLLAGCAAALVPSAARANLNPDLPDVTPLGRVELRLPEGPVAVNGLIALTGTGSLWIDLRNPVPQYDETRTVALLPNPLAPVRAALSDRLRRAVPVGRLYRDNRVLYLIADAGRTIGAEPATIVQHGLAWEPRRRLAPVNLSPMPSIEDVSRAGTPIGSVWRTDGGLVVLVNGTGAAG